MSRRRSRWDPPRHAELYQQPPNWTRQGQHGQVTWPSTATAAATTASWTRQGLPSPQRQGQVTWASTAATTTASWTRRALPRPPPPPPPPKPPPPRLTWPSNATASATTAFWTRQGLSSPQRQPLPSRPPPPPPPPPPPKPPPRLTWPSAATASATTASWTRQGLPSPQQHGQVTWPSTATASATTASRNRQGLPSSQRQGQVTWASTATAATTTASRTRQGLSSPQRQGQVTWPYPATAAATTASTPHQNAHNKRKRGRDEKHDSVGTVNAHPPDYDPHKSARFREVSDAPRTTKVRFSSKEPQVFYFVPDTKKGERDDDDDKQQISSEHNTSRLTEELTILSTVHGRCRRKLRDISKLDLQTAMKYGRKSRSTGDRWKFEFAGVVYITDNSCKTEITSWWKSTRIQWANITDIMKQEHAEATRILREDPHLVTTHSIIIIDQSGSMNISDVKGFYNRSEAAYGTLALDYVAEQLYQRGDEFLVDAVTVIEMNDTGSIIFDREPLDWILFNKLLARKVEAKPQSHGNYYESLRLAKDIIDKDLAVLNDLDEDDTPAFMLALLSDGRPSDAGWNDNTRRLALIADLATALKSKLTVFGMGVGPTDLNFDELDAIVTCAKKFGATDSQFVHAGVSSAAIGTAFTSLATAMTTTRTALMTVTDATQKTEKAYTLSSKNKPSKGRPARKVTKEVSRWKFDREAERKTRTPWSRQKMMNPDAKGFEVEVQPFARGAERLAYRFYEIRSNRHEWERVGKMMVAKESKYYEDEGDKEKFHEHFCRVQLKARKCSEDFNRAVKKAPKLRPKEDEVAKPPQIIFLKCRVYENKDDTSDVGGLLVENYLMGKFTKYNGNNGYVKRKSSSDRTIELEIGEVYLTDFVQAFSHWVYNQTDHKLLVCDLQGVLNEEGKYPKFQLTDPAICTKSKKKGEYGKTDIGMKGIRKFCQTHICNGVCRGLGLIPVGSKRGGVTRPPSPPPPPPPPNPATRRFATTPSNPSTSRRNLELETRPFH